MRCWRLCVGNIEDDQHYDHDDDDGEKIPISVWQIDFTALAEAG